MQNDLNQPSEQKNQYLALLTQAGEGCDYTIHCGTKIVSLRAETKPEAIEEAKVLLRNYTGDRRLSKLSILEVAASLAAPVDTWYSEIAKQDRAREAANEEAEARAQHEKLQARFAGK